MKKQRTETRTAKKLVLSREKIRTLPKSDLEQVVGGQPTGCTGSGSCSMDF